MVMCIFIADSGHNPAINSHDTASRAFDNGQAARYEIRNKEVILHMAFCSTVASWLWNNVTNNQVQPNTALSKKPQCVQTYQFGFHIPIQPPTPAFWRDSFINMWSFNKQPMSPIMSNLSQTTEDMLWTRLLHVWADARRHNVDDSKQHALVMHHNNDHDAETALQVLWTYGKHVQMVLQVEADALVSPQHG